MARIGAKYTCDRMDIAVWKVELSTGVAIRAPPKSESADCTRHGGVRKCLVLYHRNRKSTALTGDYAHNAVGFADPVPDQIMQPKRIERNGKR